MFFGAGIDAFSDNGGVGLGIRKDRIMAVGHNGAGLEQSFRSVSDVVTATRSGK